MSSYLPGQDSYSVSKVMISPSQQQEVAFDNLLSAKTARTLDTIAQGETQEKQKQAEVGARPSLPAPGKSSSPDYLAVLAKAFSKAFDSMADGTIENVKNYAKLQQFDETMSQCVLQSTNISITKQQKEINLVAQVKAYEEKIGEIDSIFSWIVLGIGLGIAAICTGMAVAGAIPALVEGGLFAAGETGSEIGGEIEMTELSNIDEDIDPVESEGEEVEDPNTVQISDEENIEETQNVEQQTTRQVDNSNVQNANSEESFKKKMLKWVGKKAIHMAAAAGFAAPMLIGGIGGLHTAGKLADVAKAQADVGDALAVLQTNNMYFQFYQQLLKMSGGVAQEETNDATQVVQTFADVTNGYQQINNGLASAV